MKIPLAIKSYGLSESAYIEMYTKQEGACACCENVPRRLVIDHNHATGAVRGLVCSSCNSRIGKIETRGFSCLDDDYITACKYLRTYGGNVSCQGGCERPITVRRTKGGKISAAQIIQEGRVYIINGKKEKLKRKLIDRAELRRIHLDVLAKQRIA